MFEQDIDGHHVRIAIDALTHYETIRWLAWVPVIVLAVFWLAIAASRFGTPQAPAFVALSAVATGLGVLNVVVDPEVVRQGLLELFPELGARYDDLGLMPAAAFSGAIGALLALLVDVPAWAKKERLVHALRIAAMVGAAALAYGVKGLARDALRERNVLANFAALPHVFVESRAGEQHVGLDHDVALTFTRLGDRQARGVFGERTIDPLAGSPEDLAALAAGERRRVPMDPSDQREWEPHTLSVHGPDVPGPFSAPFTTHYGPVEVSTSLTLSAHSAEGDPRWPFGAGSERIYRRTSTDNFGHDRRPEPDLILRATEAIEDGFRILTIEVSDAERSASVRVLPIDGRYERPRSGRPLPGDEAIEHLGVFLDPSCNTPLLPGTCTCSPGPYAGPTSCRMGLHPDVLEVAVAVPSPAGPIVLSSRSATTTLVSYDGHLVAR